MTKTNSALRIAIGCASIIAAPVYAGTPVACIQTESKSRLICDEGACIRVPVRDLCDAVQMSYIPKRRPVKPVRAVVAPVRDQLTLLIASIS